MHEGKWDKVNGINQHQEVKKLEARN